MNSKEIIYVAVLAMASFALGSLKWAAPGLLLTGVLVHTIDRPGRYLLPAAAAAELFSVLPLGAAAVFVLVPWLIKKASGNIEVDLSITFLLLVTAAAAAQLLALFLPFTAATLSLSGQFLTGLRQAASVPWTEAAATVGVNSMIVYTAAILVYHNKSW